MTVNRLHPDVALFDCLKTPPVIPACNHLAGSPRFLEKALALQKKMAGAFDITCDFEDGNVADVGTTAAQKLFDCILASAEEYRRVGIRLPHQNAEHWPTLLEQSIQTLGSNISFFMLPKIRSAAEFQNIAQTINQECERHGVLKKIPFHVLVETLEIFDALDAIAEHEQVECLDFGIMDYISEHLGQIPMECMRSPGQFDHAILRATKTRIASTAARYSCIASHNVTIDYQDEKLVHRDAKRAFEEFGFLRMWSIHPNQIESILKAFTPDPFITPLAQTVLLQGMEAEWGPTALKGTLYDRASYRFFWQHIKKVHALGDRLNPEITRAFFSNTQ